MAQKYGFFNAVMTNGKADRMYTADDVNTFFEGVLSDGVYQFVDNGLKVSAGASGLTVNVDTGKALIRQHWYVNDAVTQLTLTPAHATLNRYTSVVIRYDKVNRVIELATVDGTNDATPDVPTLTQKEDVWEMAIGHIYVGAGVDTLSSAQITDARSYVAGLVDPVPFNYRRYDYVVTREDGQRYFDIPHSYNFTLNSTLMIFCNGLLCLGDKYEIQVNEVEGNYMVVYPVKKELGTELSFIMVN